MEIDHYQNIPDLRNILEQREEIALDMVLSQFPSGKGRILDLGCGDGCFLSQFDVSGKNFELYGFDLSANQLAKAKKRLPNAQFQQGSLSNPFPFPDQNFDAIYCGEVLEHLVNPDHFMRESFRVLKPGGTLTMTTPNLFAWYNRVFMVFGVSPLFLEYSTEDSSVGYGVLKKFKASEQTVGHLRIFHPEAFTDIQTKYGFEILEMKAGRFEYLPKSVRWMDDAVSQISVGLGSILISTARRPEK